MEPKTKTEIALQPPKKANKRVYHSLTCDCDDVSITRLVEYINDTWVHDWNSVLNIVKMKFDIGHDILHFETNGQKLDLIKFILKLNSHFINTTVRINTSQWNTLLSTPASIRL